MKVSQDIHERRCSQGGKRLPERRRETPRTCGRGAQSIGVCPPAQATEAGRAASPPWRIAHSALVLMPPSGKKWTRSIRLPGVFAL